MRWWSSRLRGEPWERTVELRVEDHPEPLDELERLLRLHDAYALATAGDDLTGAGRHAEAGEAYRAAAALAPDNHELLFWAGLAEFDHGDRATGLAQVRRAIALQPGWRELLGRLEPEVAPAAARVLAALDGAPPGLSGPPHAAQRHRPRLARELVAVGTLGQRDRADDRFEIERPVDVRELVADVGRALPLQRRGQLLDVDLQQQEVAAARGRSGWPWPPAARRSSSG